MSDRIEGKLGRIRSGGQPRLLDLFSGCGGFTLGLQRAGYTPVGGVEVDENAARSYARNFHPADPERHEIAEAVVRAGGEIALRQVARRSAAEVDPRDAVDVITAGPPCPTFSRIGRAKLNFPHDPRKVNRATFVQRDLFLDDERNDLFESVASYAEALEPVAIVVENVPGFLNQRGQNYGRTLAEMLEGLGYETSYTLLNSASYGVPQWRERFFLMAIHQRVGVAVPQFPTPTRTLAGLPPGMMGMRKGSLKLIPGATLRDSGQLALLRTDHWVPVPSPRPGAQAPVTVGEAFADLPRFDPEKAEDPRSRSFEWKDPSIVSYAGEPSSYAKLMRTWNANYETEGIPSSQHITRNTTSDTGRDRRIFERMQQGEGYPKAHAIAEQLFEEALLELGGEEILTEARAEQLRAKYVPPYPVDKFVSKWQRLDLERPSHTLTAHLSKDSYSHIHPTEPRMITVQEAARLQSFPDSFRFWTAMSGAMRQIGNSVPPLVAEAIGTKLLEQLR